MNGVVSVMKDGNREYPVPDLWRGPISAIVNSLKEGDFELKKKCAAHVDTIPAQEAAGIAANITAYGGNLINLPEETWKTSVCRWTGESWSVLVDLSTADESPSDLVLFLKVFEDGAFYHFHVDSVHVP